MRHKKKTTRAIRSRQAFLDAIWDWGFLDGAAPRGCLPTDIDGALEIGGRFLIIEAKPPRGSMSGGQRRFYQALNAAPNMNVVLMYGDPKSQTVTEYQVMGHHDRPVSTTTEDFYEFVSDWSSWADENPYYT